MNSILALLIGTAVFTVSFGHKDIDLWIDHNIYDNYEFY